MAAKAREERGYISRGSYSFSRHKPETVVVKFNFLKKMSEFFVGGQLSVGIVEELGK